MGLVSLNYLNAIARLTVFLLAGFILMVAPVKADAIEFAAEIVDVAGEAVIIKKATKKSIHAKKGMKVIPGDSIVTGEKGSVEILYDDGNITKVAEKTKLKIEKLSIEPDASRKSVLRLAFGMIKNFVADAGERRTSFEVHTSTTVVSVAGTPLWVVATFPPGKQFSRQRTEVDLLGKRSDKGSLSVRSTVRAAEVTLKPGKRTIVAMGLRPIKPFAISPSRLSRLILDISIKTSGFKRNKKHKVIEAKTKKMEKEARARKKKEQKKKPSEIVRAMERAAEGKEVKKKPVPALVQAVIHVEAEKRPTEAPVTD